MATRRGVMGALAVLLVGCSDEPVQQLVGDVGIEAEAGSEADADVEPEPSSDSGGVPDGADADAVGHSPDVELPLDTDLADADGGGAEVAVDTTPPTVLSTDPGDAAVDVAEDVVIEIRVSEALDPDSLEVVVTDATGAVLSAAVELAEGTITATPEALLPLASLVWVSVQATDLAGNALATHQFSFSTRAPAPPEPPLLSQAALDGLAAQMDDIADNPTLAGKTFCGYVRDVDSGQEIYASAPDSPMIPASNTKIFTTAAAIGLLGPDHRFLTRVFSDGAIGPDGALNASLVIHGEHDFTWSRWFYADPRFPLDALADRLWEAGLRSVAGGVEVRGAYCYEGHHYNYYDPALHRGRVETHFVAALEARGISVSGGSWDVASMALPEGGELARWESVPLWVALWPINRKSHNEMADILNRHVGYVIGGSSDYGTGSAEIIAFMASIGLDTAGMELYDGSGLDTDNRISCRQLVDLYDAMLDLPEGDFWRRSLSVAGAQGPSSTPDNGPAIVTTNSTAYNGTLAYRMTGSDTAARVFGKSGTNAGITTSGVLFHRHHGRRYAFGFEMNQITSGVYSSARATQDALVAAFADDLLAVDLPESPVMQSVVGLGDAVEVTWTAVPGVAGVEGVDGYLLYWSDDGTTWPADQRVHVLQPSHVLSGVEDTVYVRVSAVSAAGESAPSDTYAARPGAEPARVLVIDGNDRWQGQPTDENQMAAAHAFLVPYADALGQTPFDSVANEALDDDAQLLAAYDVLIWSFGEESAADETFSGSEQALLTSYLEAGGAIFVSGAEVAWELSPSANSGASAEDEAWYQGTLRGVYAGDDAGVYVFEGAPGSIFEDVPLAGFWTPGHIFVAWPDLVEPAEGAATALVYPGVGSAAIQYEGAYRVVNLGFPFESIDVREVRQQLMSAALDFFGVD